MSGHTLFLVSQPYLKKKKRETVPNIKGPSQSDCIDVLHLKTTQNWNIHLVLLGLWVINKFYVNLLSLVMFSQVHHVHHLLLCPHRVPVDFH